ncbi:LysR family transcriptional regulator [Paracoccus aminophilus]|nr:LysR family transcriptional regulator [Paracoccus aminophilus]
MNDLSAFVAVAQAKGFREASRASGMSPSSLSEAVRRLETRLGTRLFHRTTRSVAPTEAGARLLDRLAPALTEVFASLDTVSALGDAPSGTLRLNVPVNVARLILPGIVTPFLALHPRIRLEVTAETDLVDIVAAGCDAGIRYEERLAQDMIAIPIGPRRQRFATAAAPAYLDRMGRPRHPRELLDHACLGSGSANGVAHAWTFEREGELVKIDPSGPLVVRSGAAFDLAVDAAIAGLGVISIFEDWLRPHLDSGALEPILEPWWQEFSGPFLYFSGSRLVPAPLRAFIDFIKGERDIR